MMGELSDLSCGDAWVPEVMETDQTGSSFVISRTPEASDLSVGDLLASQGHALFKKRKLKARMRLFRLCGQRVPSYRQKLLRPIPGDYVNMIKVYIARYVLSGNHRILRKLFNALRHSKRETPSAFSASCSMRCGTRNGKHPGQRSSITRPCISPEAGKGKRCCKPTRPHDSTCESRYCARTNNTD